MKKFLLVGFTIAFGFIIPMSDSYAWEMLSSEGKTKEQKIKDAIPPVIIVTTEGIFVTVFSDSNDVRHKNDSKERGIFDLGDLGL